jgi:hypothetical protein
MTCEATDPQTPEDAFSYIFPIGEWFLATALLQPFGPVQDRETVVGYLQTLQHSVGERKRKKIFPSVAPPHLCFPDLGWLSHRMGLLPFVLPALLHAQQFSDVPIRHRDTSCREWRSSDPQEPGRIFISQRNAGPGLVPVSRNDIDIFPFPFPEASWGIRPLLTTTAALLASAKSWAIHPPRCCQRRFGLILH